MHADKPAYSVKGFLISLNDDTTRAAGVLGASTLRMALWMVKAIGWIRGVANS
jgi:hypothetical protein